VDTSLDTACRVERMSMVSL